MSREFPDLPQSVPTTSAESLKQRLDSGEQVTILDTRKRPEFERWQITHPNAEVTNIPFSEFLDEAGIEQAEALPDGIPSGPLVTTCAVGLASKYVAEYLRDVGTDATILEDGMEGWASIYEQHTVDTDVSESTVIQFHRPSSGCLGYLFVAGGEAAVVDPVRAFAERYQEGAGAHGATIEFALDTHVHADHISGVRAVAEQTGATIVCPAGSVDRGLAFDSHLVEDGDTLALSGQEIVVRSLPGHTTEMVGYLFDGVLATGDTLFLDGVGRPDLEDGDEAEAAAGHLWDSLQSLRTLPEDTTVAPGHVGPTTTPREDGSFTATLGELRRLRAFDESRDEFVERVTADLPPQPANYRKIIALNLGQQTADPDEAFELELGPNNCAVSE